MAVRPAGLPDWLRTPILKCVRVCDKDGDCDWQVVSVPLTPPGGEKLPLLYINGFSLDDKLTRLT